MSTPDFVVLAPVKPFTRGKSRLVGISAARRSQLAEAFARDTLAAVLACGAVARVVVMGEEELDLPGLLVISDPVADDLNASLRALAGTAASRWPELRPVALCADLPALTPEALESALEGVRRDAPDRAAFVPDAAGSGTTLYTAPTAEFEPAFGPGSQQAHLRAGAVELDVGLGLRQDVDNPGDLDRVARLGVGPFTADLLSRA